MRKLAERYGSTAIWLHWITAALIAGTFILAWVLPRRSEPAYQGLLNLHKSVGLTILVLALARLTWRQLNPVAPARGLSPIETRMSAITHRLLYAILILIPLSGYLFSSWAGQSLDFFGLLQLSSPLGSDRSLSRPMEFAHKAGQYAVYGLVGLHVLAAIYHRLLKQDGVLQRMLPLTRSSLATGETDHGV
jgi:cytochrome b561